MRWGSCGRRQPKTWATDGHDCFDLPLHALVVKMVNIERYFFNERKGRGRKDGREEAEKKRVYIGRWKETLEWGGRRKGVRDVS